MDDRRLYAARGATTLDEDTRDQVLSRVEVLLKELITRNGIAPEDIVSIIFTATQDVHSEFPAAAARSMGLTGIPLLGALEMDVRSDVALPRCIRILMHFYGDRRPEPVYLEDAVRILENISSPQ
jgi:chorismate mutase